MASRKRPAKKPIPRRVARDELALAEWIAEEASKRGGREPSAHAIAEESRLISDARRETENLRKRKRREVKSAAKRGAAKAREAAASKSGLIGRLSKAIRRIADAFKFLTATKVQIDLAPGSTGTGPVPNTKGTPWAVIGTIAFEDSLDYAALNEGLLAVQGDDEITKLVGIDRFSRMAVLYDGPETKGSTRHVEREWTMSEIAPWDVCISRAVEMTAEDEPDSVQERYSTTAVLALRVWLAHSEASPVPF